MDELGFTRENRIDLGEIEGFRFRVSVEDFKNLLKECFLIVRGVLSSHR